MNVPNFLCGKPIKIATYFINCMPLYVLDYKTPSECLLNSNEFVVLPTRYLELFGFLLYDYRNAAGMLDQCAL
jgi:hypothetical protein